MSELLDFIKNNYIPIILIIVLVICLLVIIKLKDIELNPSKPESILTQQITIEKTNDVLLY